MDFTKLEKWVEKSGEKTAAETPEKGEEIQIEEVLETLGIESRAHSRTGGEGQREKTEEVQAKLFRKLDSFFCAFQE